MIQIIECGCYHRLDFYGDCRNNDERFPDPQEAANRLQSPVQEVWINNKGKVTTTSGTYLPTVKQPLPTPKPVAFNDTANFRHG